MLTKFLMIIYKYKFIGVTLSDVRYLNVILARIIAKFRTINHGSGQQFHWQTMEKLRIVFATPLCKTEHIHRPIRNRLNVQQINLMHPRPWNARILFMHLMNEIFKLK